MAEKELARSRAKPRSGSASTRCQSSTAIGDTRDSERPASPSPSRTRTAAGARGEPLRDRARSSSACRSGSGSTTPTGRASGSIRPLRHGSRGCDVRCSTSMRDQFGRQIEYLRISVTDRCNFRCLYCMPAEGCSGCPSQDILSYEEIADVVAQLAPLGLRRLRITGGEPTIRPDLATLVAMLAGSGHRGHRALDERRAAAGAAPGAAGRGPRPRQHERRLAAPRPHRGDRAARTWASTRSRGARRRGGRTRPDQDQRRRDARHQRRRDRATSRGSRSTSVARALHRADAGRRACAT